MATRKLLLRLAVVAVCTSLAFTSTTPERGRRHISTDGESSQRVDRTQDNQYNKFDSRNNFGATTKERKESHRLVGGHLTLEAKPRSRKNGVESLWDDGILLSSSGNGKENKKSSGEVDSKNDDDEKKSLSQQVKEGKYGLIQDEISPKEPKRPGIISYLKNPEVPRDNVENLGGLDEEEIWLSENHVLVLKGGHLSEHDEEQQGGGGGGNKDPKWPPIDNYEAPRRQVKIPRWPKVPPPFPVQLSDNEPVSIIGLNGTLIDASKAILTDSPFPIYPDPSYAPARNLTKDSDGSAEKRAKSNVDADNPVFHSLPPGAVFVPPPSSNQSDYDDEDQSIYYPPPYSFVYKQDNTTVVPPGPLVPGIILPPPPDFFSALDEKTSKTKYPKRPSSSTTPAPTKSRNAYLPPARKFAKYDKVQEYETTTSRTTTSLPLLRTSFKSNSINVINETNESSSGNNNNNNEPLTNTSEEKVIEFLVTTLAPVAKPTTLESAELYTIKPLISNQVVETSTRYKGGGVESGKSRLPLLDYFVPSTTPAPSYKSVAVEAAGRDRTPSQASYYFYEESGDNTAGTTPPAAIYYRTTTETPFFKFDKERKNKHKEQQYYSVEMIPSQQTSKDYNVKLLDALMKEPKIYQYAEGNGQQQQQQQKQEAKSTRTQGQRVLSEPAIYYEAISVRPKINLHSYFTTPTPDASFYQSQEKKGNKPKPIYQYSFEAADYAKLGQRPYYKHLTSHQVVKQQPSSGHQVQYTDYQDIQSTDQYNDYESSEPKSIHRYQGAKAYKSAKPIIYGTTTLRPVLLSHETGTQNPQHAYYTQQDEKLLDDVTKEYFTIFGKKLAGRVAVQSTTPLYGKTSAVTEIPIKINAYDYDVRQQYKTPKVRVHYGDQVHRPYSLKDDTLVNYKHPLPPINPESEFISVGKPNRAPLQHVPPSPFNNQGPVQFQSYRQQEQQQQPNQGFVPMRNYAPAPQAAPIQQQPRPQGGFLPYVRPSEEDRRPVYHRPVSLAQDIAVNYRDPRPPINPDAELIGQHVGQPENHADKPSAYFAYRLPGDGGHFYFLTPQTISQRRAEQSGYLYSRPREPRLLRRRRGPPVI